VLAAEGVVTGYGRRLVLDGVTVSMKEGEVVALIGHNGAGKSTLLKALFGLLPLWGGRILIDGRVLTPSNRFELVHLGIAYVPQGCRVFSDLTVMENLELAGVPVRSRQRFRKGVERVFRLFPTLSAREKQRAGSLSGGEKQALALGSALVRFPRILLVDEPSMGLAPLLVKQTMERIHELNEREGLTVMIVEQKVREVIRIADEVYVLRSGVVSFHGPAEVLSDEAKLREVYL
jgi:branched-chain amino acid transport system ATP-binding protein